MDWSRYGLPAELSLRVGLHAGPVYYAADPITKRHNAIGDHVAQAAAIEAATQVGRACASRQFAALAAAESPAEFRCHYLGVAPATTRAECVPVYEVRGNPIARPLDPPPCAEPLVAASISLAAGTIE
jgi:class 3 adenylate cyclase